MSACNAGLWGAARKRQKLIILSARRRAQDEAIELPFEVSRILHRLELSVLARPTPRTNQRTHASGTIITQVDSLVDDRSGLDHQLGPAGERTVLPPERHIAQLAEHDLCSGEHKRLAHKVTTYTKGVSGRAESERSMRTDTVALSIRE